MRRATAAVLLCLAALAAIVPAAAADTVDDYSARVGRARELLRLADTDLTAEEAAALAEAVEAELPAGERVDAGVSEVTPDRAVLERALLRLRGAGSAAERAAAAGDLEAQLESLRLAMGPSNREPAVAPDRAVLDELLARQVLDTRSALGERIRAFFDKMLDAIVRWWSGAAAGGSPGRSLALAVGTGVVAFVLAFVAWRTVRSARRLTGAADAAAAGAADAPVVAAAEGLPEDAEAFAEALAAEGRTREAVRALFGGAARSLVGRGVVRQTRTRTDAELLAEAAAAVPGVRGPLGDLTDAFESAWYGHVEPGTGGYAGALASYRRTLAAVGEAGT